MKYIRTKGGIEKLDDDWALFCKDHASNKLVDTIEELCDEIVEVIEDKAQVVYADISFNDLAIAKIRYKNNAIIYGAIWVFDSNGVPTLKSVAKMNDKGELELL